MKRKNMNMKIANEKKNRTNNDRSCGEKFCGKNQFVFLQANLSCRGGCNRSQINYFRHREVKIGLSLLVFLASAFSSTPSHLVVDAAAVADWSDASTVYHGLQPRTTAQGNAESASSHYSIPNQV